MKRKLNILLVVLVLAGLILAACTPNGEGNQSDTAKNNSVENGVNDGDGNSGDSGEGDAAANEVTIIIGFTTSITGKYETSSGRQARGFDLWMQALNAAGGIGLSDGTVVKFASVTYDDESNSDRVQELYTRLATEDEADLMISPYSSGLTSAASIIAEQYGKVMVTTGAASDSNYTQGFTQVFQIYTPASRYLTGAVDLLRNDNPEITKIAFVYENAQFSTDVVSAAKDYAESLGYEVVLFEGYPSDIQDFGPFINKIEASGAEAILGGGHFNDGSTFARQIEEKETDINFFALLVAPPEPDFADLGEAALGVIGPVNGNRWPPLHRIRRKRQGWNGLAPPARNSLRITPQLTMKNLPITQPGDLRRD